MPVAKINGVNIDYTIKGQGEPLVMIMGMGAGQKGWMFQTEFFKKYFQVITFDNRGAGNSDKPAGPYSTRQMADETIGLMDYLKIDKAHLLGISLGGMIAQELAINYPLRVNRLILGCTFCKKDNSTEFPEWGQAIKSCLKGDYDPMFNGLFNKRFNRVIMGSIMKKALKKSGEAGRAGIAGQYQASNTHDTTARLNLVKSPTLVIGGTADRVMKPDSFKDLSGLISQSRLVMIEDGSHSMFVESRRRFNQEVLNFLRSA
jgi:pimeloyl-ACP methyl ester carboxylesterase